jgi:pantoate--beta-alanine ligase
MGNIHDGHLSLINLAKKSSSFVICSIFVNPLQFNDDTDFEKYPRTLEADLEKLRLSGTDLVFFPHFKEIYPTRQEFFIDIPDYLGNILEGEFRQNFFSHVSTIVLKLIVITNPKFVFFGNKDYQQAIVVKKLCEQFCLGCNFIQGDTVRDNSGLALSSRNAYLSSTEKVQATQLYQQLYAAKIELINAFDHKSLNSEKLLEIEKQHRMQLTKKGWRPDYFTIMNKRTFRKPIEPTKEFNTLIILSAAWLGNTRLIDNLEII